MPISETSKYRHLTVPYCQGAGVDIGSAGDPVVPWAIQIDLEQPYCPLIGPGPIHLKGDGRRLDWFDDQSLDFVYSSHLIEDFEADSWGRVLREWDRVLKSGGHLIILAPEAERWRAALAVGQPPNEAHRHEPHEGELTDALEVQTYSEYQVVMDACPEPDDYGIVFIAKKLGDYPLDKISQWEETPIWWTLPPAGAAVKRINTHAFYSLGNKLKVCAGVDEQTVYGDVWFQLDQARDALKAFLDSDLVSIKTCRESGSSLVAAITEAVPLDFTAASSQDKTVTLSWLAAYHIRNRTTEFQTVLAAELNLLDTYVVSQKGAYSTSDLIDHAELLIPDSLRGMLPQQATVDIQQAGKCIAYDVPTGAAFHILRATESVIRAYYLHVLGILPKPKMRNWGAYAKNLKAGGADPKITSYIDHLRELYRNPIFHPEDNLALEEAQMFLGACVSAICHMLIAIRDTAPKLPAPGPTTAQQLLAAALLGPGTP
jgi:predicted SAM-dependent methyltransferase